MVRPKNLNLVYIGRDCECLKESWPLTGMFRVGLWKGKFLSWAFTDLSMLWKLVGWCGGHNRSSYALLKSPFVFHSLFSVYCSVTPPSACPDWDQHVASWLSLTYFSIPLWNHPWTVPVLGNLHQHFPGVLIPALLLRCKCWGNNTRAVTEVKWRRGSHNTLHKPHQTQRICKFTFARISCFPRLLS